LKPALVATAALTGIQVGAALVASEAIVADVGSGRLGFLRYAIALLFLLPIVLASKAPAIARRHLLPIALIGIGQFGLLIAVLNFALLYTSSARVALVFATLPILTLAVSIVLGQPSPGIRALFPILLTLLGIVWLLGSDALSGTASAGDLIGLAAAFVATLTGAVCSVLYRPYLERYGVVRISAVAMAASLPPLGLLGLVEPSGVSFGQWPTQVFVLIGFVGLSSGIGYLLWLHALSKADATRATAFLALSPVTATALSVWLLREPATPSLIAAILLVGAGLVALSRTSRVATGTTDDGA
jgi:drug/metabolite transporter (DMT)-like permease